jgi:hypothetical protein
LSTRAARQPRFADRLDFNTASQQGLEDLPMVGPERARAPMQPRPLRSWKDVERVPGFDGGMIDDLRSEGAPSRRAVSASACLFGPHIVVLRRSQHHPAYAR